MGRSRKRPIDIGQDWKFSGDVNLEYGGIFVKVDLDDYHNGYLSATVVTDLDSACGATGMVLIEQKVALVDHKRIMEAIRSCGFEVADLLRMESETALCAIAEMLISYGHSDPGGDAYSPSDEIVQTEFDAPMTFEGWKAEKRIARKDLRGYVAHNWLD